MLSSYCVHLFLLCILLPWSTLAQDSLDRERSSRLYLRKRKRQDVSSEIVSLVITETTVIATPSSLPAVTVVITSTLAEGSRTQNIPITRTTVVQSTVTTTPQSTTATAQCAQGLYLCADEYGGGCCGIGFQCALSSCIPPATLVASSTCQPSYQLCPASVSYGCCPSSLICGATDCSFPSATSPPISKKSEVDIGMKYSTIPPFSTSTSTSISSPQQPDEGLSNVALGGIIAGSILGVIALGVAAWFSYRRVQNRQDTEPPGARNSHGSEDVISVVTANVFDPHAPPPAVAAGKKRNNRDRSNSMSAGWMAKHSNGRSRSSPVSEVRDEGNALSGFDFGFGNSNASVGVGPARAGVGVEQAAGECMWETSGTHDQVLQAPVEMAAREERRDEVFEIDGTGVNERGRDRRWNRGLFGR